MSEENKEDKKVVCSNCGRELHPTDEYWRVGNDPVLSKYFGASKDMIFCSRECIQQFLFVKDGSDLIKQTDDYHADEIENYSNGAIYKDDDEDAENYYRDVTGEDGDDVEDDDGDETLV